MDNLDKEMQNILSANPQLNRSKALTHQEFVNGIKNREIEFNLIGESADFLSEKDRKKFLRLVMMYWITPIFIVPIISYILGNWWLLFGVMLSWLGSITAARHLGVFVCIYLIIEAFLGNFKLTDYGIFFGCCVLFGYILFRIPDAFQETYARADILDKPELYNLAVEKNRIIITPSKTV